MERECIKIGEKGRDWKIVSFIGCIVDLGIYFNSNGKLWKGFDLGVI